ncbi:hypothetical protein B0H19DRAFT_1374900 [Mycena capillaripes]|nr:hypothetical protein B0H19DRAFT_1374900 [Mycena capillaripes]
MRASIGHTSLILALDKHPDTSKIIRSTPGVRRILVSAWKFVLYDDEAFGQGGAFGIISEILFIVTERKDMRALDEVVEAVGGSMKDLASTIIRHFASARASPNAYLTGDFIRACFPFLADSSDAIHSLLPSMGFIPMVIAIVSSLNPTEAVDAAQLCVNYLLVHLESPSEIALAMESDLLRAIINVAASIKTDKATLYPSVRDMLDKQLPCSLVHYVVVSQLKKCFQAATEFAAKSRIHASAFSTNWKGLAAMMKARLEFIDSWEVQLRPSFKACDNLTCGSIGVRRSFKCCGTCQSADYCSEKCQSADWVAGHRDVCHRLSSFRLENPETLTTRGKSFMRALLTHDYRRLMLDVCIQQVLFMHEHPGVEFFTLFSYVSCGDVIPEFQPRSKLETEDWASRTPLDFLPAARGSGRMDLHLMVTFEGRTFRPLLFPMRITTTKLRDGLARRLRRPFRSSKELWTA